MPGQVLRGVQVADARGQADSVGEQVLDLLEFLAIVGESGSQLGQGLRQLVAVLAVQAPGQGQRADHPVPDPLGVRGRSRQVPPGGDDVTAVESDSGGDPKVAARRGGLLEILVQYLDLS